MKMGKYLIILIVLITFLLSVGGVCAQDDGNNLTDIETSSLGSVNDVQMVLSDNALYENGNLSSDDSLVADFIADTTGGEKSITVAFTDNSTGKVTSWLWDFGDGATSSLKNPTHTYDSYGYFNVSLKVSNSSSSDIVLKEDFIHVAHDNPVVVNGNFEDSTKPIGWNYSAVSIYSYGKYAKNGKKFLSLSENGYLSQIINLNSVDYITFWHSSESKNSRLRIQVDGVEIFEYQIETTGMGKWGMVLLNLTNYTGFHELKIIQKGSSGYVDYFNVIHNEDLYVNFTLTSHSLVGDNLTLGFTDHSYGLIDGWLWDFGDGNTSTEQNPTHSFKSGHYTVSLCIYNKNNAEYAYWEIPITFPCIVGTGEEFNSVQKAIDAAQDGDTINVQNNIFYHKYLENIVVNKSLTINFFNCTLVSDGVTPVITATNGAEVIVTNISFDKGVILKTDGTSKLTITESNVLENLLLGEGNIELENNNFNNIEIEIVNANVTINDCNFINSEIVLNNGVLLVNKSVLSSSDVSLNQKGGKSRIINSTITNNTIGVLNTNGELFISNTTISNNEVGVSNINGSGDIRSNFIFNNTIGVNITNGSSNFTLNVVHTNKVGLLFSNSDVVKDNNWWGTNEPTFTYGYLQYGSDVCQLDGIESQISSWLVLSIAQSLDLDFEYYIAGITNYNLTIDLTHNNLGEEVTNNGNIIDLIISVNGSDMFNSVDYDSHVIKNGIGYCIFSLGYLTGDLTQINVSVLGKDFTVDLVNDTTSPEITYVTPSTIFDDNCIVEFKTDSDATIFYTLDGTNPGYSKTRLVYTEAITLNESSTVHYTIINRYGYFHKQLMDYSFNVNYVISAEKQDVFVEIYDQRDAPYLQDRIYGSDVFYYTLDGTSPSSSNPSAKRYYHPFNIYNLSVITTQGRSGARFYSFDNSINYIKNTTAENSGAIWGEYQGDNKNSGISNYTGPLTNKTAWNNMEITSSASAVVDNNGHIYIGGDDGYLYSLNVQGLVIWRWGTTSKIICTPTIGPDGNIYFSNWMDSNAYCISPNGTLMWKLHLGDYNTGTSPVFGPNNRLYIITSADIYSTIFVIENGTIVANHTIPYISGSTPAVGEDGSLYLVSGDHQFIILNWDGSLRYAEYIDNSSIIDKAKPNTHISVSIGPDGTVYVANYLRKENMFHTWIPNEQMWIYRNMVFDTDILNDLIANGYGYGGTTENPYNFYLWISYNLNAYYPNGTLKWTMINQRQGLSGTPTYYDGVLYVSGNKGLIAVNATNGRFIWEKAISDTGLTAISPVIARDGVIYTASNNFVYAFALDGYKIWEYEFIDEEYGNPVIYSSPTLTNDKTLIVTTNQGIYAFNDIAADFKYEHVPDTAATIQFTDLSTEGDNLYYWMFGDGNFSREQNPVHEYAKGGKYFVTLLVYHDNITLARNMTVRVKFNDIIPPTNVTAFIDGNITYGGIFNETQYLILNATDESGGVTIYYTLDGSNPINSTNRRVFNGILDIEADCVLNMVALDTAGNYGNVTNLTFTITDSFIINSTLISDIQAMLDNAEPGSKVVFDYPVIYGANFTVDKPLNIITNVGTQLVGNGEQAVFTFTQNATGSILNGFIVNNTNAEGIVVKDTANVTIRDCKVNVTGSNGIHVINCTNTTVKYTSVSDADEGIIINQSTNTSVTAVHVNDCYSDGIWVVNSTLSNITDSIVEDNGKDPYKINCGANKFDVDKYGRLQFVTTIPASESRANNILIDNSSDTNILNNTVNRGYFGIHLLHNTYNTVIDNNTINNTVGDGILLSNFYDGVNITHNAIRESFNGINFMGHSEAVYIAHNLIDRVQDHPGSIYMADEMELYDLAGYVYDHYFPGDQLFNHYANGIQVSHGASNFHEGNTTIIDNVVIRVGHRAWESRKYQHFLDAGCNGYGYNLMDGSASLTGAGGATRYVEGKVDLVVDRIGDATYRLRLINRLDDHYVSEIPEFDLTFTTGGFTQTVYFKDSEAIAKFDVAMALSDVEAIISNEIRKSVHFNIEITEGFSSSNRAVDPGLEKGDAWNNPNPVIPKFPFEDYKPYTPPEKPDTGYGNGTGNGNGNGNGAGVGNGDGNGSLGSFGTGKNNMFGKMNEKAGVVSNVTGIGDISTSDEPSQDNTDGMDRSSEGGSDAGSGKTIKAYEVKKQINMENVNEYGFIFVILLLLSTIIIGYAKKRYYEGGEL